MGYLIHLALNEHKSFAALLGRVLPLQITGKDDGPVEVVKYETVEEAKAALRAAGLPEHGVYIAPEAVLTRPSWASSWRLHCARGCADRRLQIVTFKFTASCKPRRHCRMRFLEPRHIICAPARQLAPQANWASRSALANAAGRR